MTSQELIQREFSKNSQLKIEKFLNYVLSKKNWVNVIPHNNTNTLEKSIVMHRRKRLLEKCLINKTAVLNFHSLITKCNNFKSQ